MEETTNPGAQAPNGKPKGPPGDIPPSDLFLLLSTIPRPHRLVPIPRKLPGTNTDAGDIVVRPLSQEEHHEANAAADAYVKKLLQSPQKKDEANIGYANLFANELAVQQLWRACRDPNDHGRPAFPAPKQLRMLLTSDEVGVMYNHFLTAQAELGPIIATMEPEEYDAWVRRLAEGGQAFPFDLLSWDLRIHLVRTMARQIVNSWTDTSSAGRPPDGSTSPNSGDSTTPAQSKSDEPPSLLSGSESDDAPPATTDDPATPDPDTGS